MTFALKRPPTKGDLAEIADIDDLELTARKHVEKRSLSANGLMWLCLGQIAVALKTDKWDVYLTMLKRYGRYTYIAVREHAVEALKKQWRECEVVGEVEVNGQKAVQVLCYYGSSTYNSKEFSRLLDGIISEMQEMGLPTPMPEDIRVAIERLEKKENVES